MKDYKVQLSAEWISIKEKSLWYGNGTETEQRDFFDKYELILQWSKFEWNNYYSKINLTPIMKHNFRQNSYNVSVTTIFISSRGLIGPITQRWVICGKG